MDLLSARFSTNEADISSQKRIMSSLSREFRVQDTVLSRINSSDDQMERIV